METNLTLKEISERTGVSIATVSRVLSNADNVSQSTKNRVLSAVNEGGRDKTTLIALIVPDSANNFFVQLLQGIQSISRLQNYEIIVIHTENSERNEEKSLRTLLEINAGGILFIGTGQSSRLLRTIVNEGKTPIVFLDRDPEIENSYLVTADSSGGMYQAANYLLSLGHRHILYMEGTEGISVSRQRREGLKKALAQHEIPENSVTIAGANFNLDEAYVQVNQMITSGIFNSTAVCAANDMMALGAYKALSENRYRIPDDVSLIGYDDIPATSILNLTTIHQPYVEMGRTAMMTLHALIAGSFDPAKMNVLGTSLIIRNSCTRVKEADSE